MTVPDLGIFFAALLFLVLPLFSWCLPVCPKDITLTDFHLNFVDSLEDVSMEQHQAMLHHPTMGSLDSLKYFTDRSCAILNFEHPQGLEDDMGMSV